VEDGTFCGQGELGKGCSARVRRVLGKKRLAIKRKRGGWKIGGKGLEGFVYRLKAS